MENSALSNVVRRTVISNQQRRIQEGLEESSWDMYVETEDGISHYEDSSMISDAASPIIYEKGLNKKGIMNEEYCAELKKRGLCLVPLSMFSILGDLWTIYKHVVLPRSARKQPSFVVHIDAELPPWFTEST
ncbi:hypothetical protein IGI04_019908 [Brassica rapa subsp. trilocularis]|uniref:Uncharacterized protein n=1 Tax=Brassica rapa subsp. trilocularis TaxID=1813537 RepID=A0ABQ7MH94_BRACM|nr:hypothetical protein IGI04_019908 [Brassica rapa subsp. trilocularis]